MGKGSGGRETARSKASRQTRECGPRCQPVRRRMQFGRTPITGIALCCARAASGHTAAPPTNEMKVRRLIYYSSRRAKADRRS